MKSAKNEYLDTVFNISMTKDDRQALADRARLENSSSNAIARQAIRFYLSYTRPNQNPIVESLRNYATIGFF